MKQQVLDTIRIELVVVACQGYNDEVHMQGQLEIYINQKKPYDESSDIIDVENLLNSIEKDGEYKIFSCCCGKPECSGWYKGINVVTNDLEIKWTNENNNENWTFEKTSVLDQLRTVRKEAIFYKNFFRKKDIEYVGVGYDW
ncbi:MAG: hypothetical protein HYZ14_04005 [Bacteroidetes bacterium]|nr:hypothetical protein [Bacteroidota bacterium]